MEVILSQDVYNLGHKDDVVNVKHGYARNYLIPRGYAIMASDTNKKIHAEIMKQRAFKEEKVKKEAQKTAELLKNIKISIGAKAGASGKIFGSVNALQIAEAIKAQHGIEVDRKKIMVNGDAIKEIGQFSAKINLHKEVSVELNFDVVAE